MARVTPAVFGLSTIIIGIVMSNYDNRVFLPKASWFTGYAVFVGMAVLATTGRHVRRVLGAVLGMMLVSVYLLRSISFVLWIVMENEPDRRNFYPSIVGVVLWATAGFAIARAWGRDVMPYLPPYELHPPEATISDVEDTDDHHRAGA